MVSTRESGPLRLPPPLMAVPPESETARGRSMPCDREWPKVSVLTTDHEFVYLYATSGTANTTQVLGVYNFLWKFIYIPKFKTVRVLYF